MSRTKMLLQVAAILSVLLALCSGCATAGATPSGPAASDAATPIAAVVTPAGTQQPEPTAGPTPSPQAAAGPAFRYYAAVKIGMTKDEVAEATGLKGEAVTGEYVPEGAFIYLDAEKYGVYVLYSKSGKVYSKTVQIADPVRDLAPLTAKPVTKELCGQIKLGMSHEDVAKLLGCEGVETSFKANEETLQDEGPVVCWVNSDGSLIRAYFKADGTVLIAIFEQPAERPTHPPQQAALCPAFKYYEAVAIGMTKGEVGKATGLTAKKATGEYDPEGAYYYLDADGYGIYVIFNKGGKLYNKTVQYKDVAKDLAPLTQKPVTEEQCGKITDGMKRADVEALLGPGVECSATANKMETLEGVGPILRWGNRDGSFLQVVILPDGTARNAMFFEH